MKEKLNTKPVKIVVVAILLIVLSFLGRAVHHEYIMHQVKDSFAEGQPYHTVEECFNDFLANPEWHYKRDNGYDIVYVKGTCMYSDQEVEVIQEFVVKDESWKTSNLYMDGKIVNDLLAAAFRLVVFNTQYDNPQYDNQGNNEYMCPHCGWFGTIDDSGMCSHCGWYNEGGIYN